MSNQNEPEVFTWSEDHLELVADQLKVDMHDPALIRETAQAVKNLSQLFLHKAVPKKKEKLRFGRYGDAQGMRSGYSLYYLLANLPKIVHILENFGENIWESKSVLDVGIGPGTASLAVLATRIRNHCFSSFELTGIDTSQGFLDVANNLLRSFADQSNIRIHSNFIRQDLTRTDTGVSGRYDLVMAANVLGEIQPDRINDVVRKITQSVSDNGKLLIMEPALRTTGRQLLEVRERLLGTGWSMLSPCPGSYPCPALTLARDWCHHRLAWRPPAFLEAVDRAAGFKKNCLNFSYLLMCRQQEVRIALSKSLPETDRVDTGMVLVVSDLLKRKGKRELHVCGSVALYAEAGKHVVVLANKLRSNENRGFEQLKRYDRVRFRKVQILRDRILLHEDSSVERLI